MEDRLHKPVLLDSVPLIGADQAWEDGYDGTGRTVAVIDSGVDSTHPFLAGRVVEEACYSTTSGVQSTTLCPNGADEQIGPGAGKHCSLDLEGCWHGTHVAGIVAGDGVLFGLPIGESGAAPASWRSRCSRGSPASCSAAARRRVWARSPPTSSPASSGSTSYGPRTTLPRST